MKKIFAGFVLILSIAGIYVSWNIFGPTVSAPENKYFYITTGSNFEKVKKELQQQAIISGNFFFDKLARQTKYNKNVKAGRYEIKEGMSLYGLIRMLRSGKQSPVKLVINKLRTKEDLARKIGQQFECDSLDAIHFLSNNDSLKIYGLDSQNVMQAVIPNTAH
jgi:UPF0755 protein